MQLVKADLLRPTQEPSCQLKWCWVVPHVGLTPYLLVLLSVTSYWYCGIVCLAATSIDLRVVLSQIQYYNSWSCVVYVSLKHLLPELCLFEQHPVYLHHRHCLTVFNSNQSGMLKLSNNNNDCNLHNFLFTYCKAKTIKK